MNPVLVDSSIWIDFLRHNHFLQPLMNLGAEIRLATCAVVQVEILPFLKRKAFQEDFAALRYFPFQDDDWREAVQIQEQILHARLNSLSVPDLIIATVCRLHKLLLFTKDKDFFRVKDVIGLDLYE